MTVKVNKSKIGNTLYFYNKQEHEKYILTGVE